MTIGVRNHPAASGIRRQATVDAVSVGVIGNNKDVPIGLFLGLLFGVSGSGAAGKKQSQKSGHRGARTHGTPKRNPIDRRRCN